jgi:hypothetical protein
VVDSAGQARFYLPGDPSLPPGIIPWYNECVSALVEGNQGRFLTTPHSPAHHNTLSYGYVFNLDERLAIKGDVDLQVAGQWSHFARDRLEDAEPDEYDGLVVDLMQTFMPKSELDSLKCVISDDRYGPVTIDGYAEYPALSEQGGRVLLKPGDYMVDYDNPFVAESRENEIIFTVAHKRFESAQFTLPEGWTVEAAPADTMFYNEVGSCSIQYLTAGNQFSVQRNFTLNSPYWEARDYVKVRRLFQERQNISEGVMVLSKAQPGMVSSDTTGVGN